MKTNTRALLKSVLSVSCFHMPSNMCSMNIVDVGKIPCVLEPPDKVKGMKKLDKSAFDKSVTLPALFFENSRSAASAIRVVKKFQLKLPNLMPVQSLESNDTPSDNKFNKYILLNPSLVSDFSTLHESVRSELNLIDVNQHNFRYVKQTLTFDNWAIDDVIKAVLPDNLKFSGYTLIGHIAHFNLREELLDYKYIIGETILEKIKRVKTVVNKINIIDNSYRNFEMELLCGEDNMITTLKENACLFEMDFSKVYWNSRLGTEHERIVRLLRKGDVLYDVFAGIGPFVIPAAKKGCVVLANDLNPHSIHWLKRNISLNKLSGKVECFNCDAKEFISTHLKAHLLKIVDRKSSDEFTAHVTMNLPALAVNFIDDFRGLVTQDEFDIIPKKILLHVYCFIREEFLEKKSAEYLDGCAKTLVETHLQKSFTDNLVEVLNVRRVAPNKAMCRVSFYLEPDFLIRKSVKRGSDDANVGDS